MRSKLTSDPDRQARKQVNLADYDRQQALQQQLEAELAAEQSATA